MRRAYAFSAAFVTADDLLEVVSHASMKAVAFALPWAANALSPDFGAAGEAIRVAGAATSDVAERLPNWYSSKQGLTEESPAVFGTAGMGLTHAGGALVDGRDPAADITFAACALEPIELDTDLHDAADAFLANDPHAAAESFDAAAASFDVYAELLSREDHADTHEGAGATLARAASALRDAANALR